MSLMMRTSLAQIWPCQPLSILKVQPFYMRLIIMHLMNWCSTIKCVYFHFQNYLHGLREGLIAYGKHGRLMKLIGDQIQVFPTSSTWTPRHFWSKERKIKSNTFWDWIRTPRQLQLVMFTTVAYGLGLRRSSTSWNPYEVYFHMDLESSPYLFWGGRNDRITTERFSVQRCCVALVWSNGPCIKLGPLGMRPRAKLRRRSTFEQKTSQ